MVVTGMSLWSAFRKALLEGLEDETGPLRARASRELVAFGERIGTGRRTPRAAGRLGLPTSRSGRSGGTATS